MKFAVVLSRHSWTARDSFARLRIAANRSGHEAVALTSRGDDALQDCDFVLALDTDHPRLGSLPNYVVLHEPTSTQSDAVRRNTLSFDGFLSLEPGVRGEAASLALALGRPFAPAAEFAVTSLICGAGAAQWPPNLSLLVSPALMAMAADKELLDGLAELSWVRCYEYGEAPLGAEARLPHGPTRIPGRDSNSIVLVPDGTSRQRAYAECGIGLYLPNSDGSHVMPLELCDMLAAGAGAIVAGSRFLRDAFGDSLMFLEEDLPVHARATRIQEYVAQARSDSERTRSRAVAARQTFENRFGLDRLLSNLVAMHQELVVRRGSRPAADVAPASAISVVVSCSATDDNESLRRTAAMIAAQTWRPLHVILAYPKLFTDRAADLAREFESQGVSATAVAADEGFLLPASYPELVGDFFTIVDCFTSWFPRHLATLVHTLLEDRNQAGGAVVAQAGLILHGPEDDELARPPDPRFGRAVPLPGTWLARTDRFDSELRADPDINLVGDNALLAHLLCGRPWISTGEVTCARMEAAPNHHAGCIWPEKAPDARLGFNLVKDARLIVYAERRFKSVRIMPAPTSPHLAPAGQYRTVALRCEPVWVAHGRYAVYLTLRPAPGRNDEAMLFACDVATLDGRVIRPAHEFTRIDGYSLAGPDSGFVVYRVPFEVADETAAVIVKLWTFDSGVEFWLRSIRVLPWPSPTPGLLGSELRGTLMPLYQQSKITGRGALVAEDAGDNLVLHVPLRARPEGLAPRAYQLSLSVRPGRAYVSNRALLGYDIVAENGEPLQFRQDVFPEASQILPDGGRACVLRLDLQSMAPRHGAIDVRVWACGNGGFEVLSARVTAT